MSAAADERLDLVGIGSMVVDRVHRAPRTLGAEAKVHPARRRARRPGARPTSAAWCSTTWAGRRRSGCGRASSAGRRDDANGRFLRARHGPPRHRARISCSTAPPARSRRSSSTTPASAPSTWRRARPPRRPPSTSGAITRSTSGARERLTTEVSQLPARGGARGAARSRARPAIPTVVDLDVPPSDALAELGDEATLDAVLRAADLLKPAKRAARELVSGRRRGCARRWRAAVRARFGNAAVVVTDGAAGCAIAAEGFEGFVPARRVQAVDTTGAGDAFLGGLLAALHHGLDWEDAGRLANACGAACAEQLGAFPDDPARARARGARALRRPRAGAGPACSRARPHAAARAPRGARRLRRRAGGARARCASAWTRGSFESGAGAGARCARGGGTRARDGRRQARARRPLRGVAALLDGNAGHLPRTPRRPCTAAPARSWPATS